MLKLVGGSLLFLGLFAVIAAAAGEPVEVVVEGLEGEVLKNVRTALTLPADLVKEGKVDLLWLTRFEGQIPEKFGGPWNPSGITNPGSRSLWRSRRTKFIAFMCTWSRDRR